jgi:hypothetical protein
MSRRKQGSFKDYQEEMEIQIARVTREFEEADLSDDLFYIDYTLRAIFDSLELNKSQGWTEHMNPGTKAAWESPAEFRKLISFIKARLFVRMVFGFESMALLTPHDAVYYGIKDPEKLFIKDEPHSQAKIDSNRYRLIWAPSLADTLLLGLTTRRFDKQNIACFQLGDVDSYGIGMGHHDAGLSRTGVVIGRMLVEAHANGYRTIQGADYSGWDISVCRDAMLSVSQVRKNKVSGLDPYATSLAHEIIDIEHLCLSSHVIEVDGTLTTVRVFGIVGSGTLVTGSNNTLANLLMTSVAGARDMHCVSDDNIYWGKVDPAAIDAFGLTLKDTVRCTIEYDRGMLKVENVPFTSHVYTVSQVLPATPPHEMLVQSTKVGKPFTKKPTVQVEYANPSKLLANLVHKTKHVGWLVGGQVMTHTVDEDIVRGVAFALRHSEYLTDVVQEYLELIDPDRFDSQWVHLFQVLDPDWVERLPDDFGIEASRFEDPVPRFQRTWPRHVPPPPHNRRLLDLV